MSAWLILFSPIFITNMAAGKCREICLSQRADHAREVAPAVRVQSYIRIHPLKLKTNTCAAALLIKQKKASEVFSTTQV